MKKAFMTNESGFMTNKSGYMMKSGFMTNESVYMMKSGFMTNKSGFTLIEIIVSMAIGSIIIMVITGIFLISSESHRKYTNQEELSQNARVALERISRDLRQTSSIITDLPATNTDPLNPPSHEIFFQDGHYTEKIRYISYYLADSSLRRQVSHYNFSANPDIWVNYNAKDNFDNPPTKIIDEDSIRAEQINSLDFYGNNLVQIDLSVSNETNSFSFHTEILGRNL